MAKITLTDLANLQNETTAVNAINANNAAIETAMENTLSRDGTVPNTMGANLDMNSNQILNLPAPASASSPVRLQDVVDSATIASVPPVGTSGAVVGLLNANNTHSGNNTFSGTNTFSGANTVTLASGLVGTPSLTFSGDTDTGVYRPGANALAFSTGGTEAMRATGGALRVGLVGSFTGTEKLSVNGFAVIGTETTGPALLLGDTGAGSAVIGNFYAQDVEFRSNNTERMRLGSAGGLTIGPNGTTNLGASTLNVASSIRSGGSILSTSPTAGVGYLTGAGGTVTQATSKSTGVTLNTLCGQITTNNAALAAATIVSFTVTNSAVAAADSIILNHQSGGTVGSYTLNAQPAAGSFTINIRNNTAGSLGEALVINYAVIKGVTS